MSLTYLIIKKITHDVMIMKKNNFIYEKEDVISINNL